MVFWKILMLFCKNDNAILEYRYFGKWYNAFLESDNAILENDAILENNTTIMTFFVLFLTGYY